jgi:L-asparaginase II
MGDNAGLPAFPPLMPTATASSAPSAAGHVPLTLVTRGNTVECVHTGSVAVVDVDGRILFAAGDPESLTFTRSALKPLQALPFVAAGGVERFGYALPQVALLCASHAGESRHVDAVAGMLASAGNTAADLQCGTHAPAYFQARGEVPPPPPYSVLAHNCSGKHSGMLAHCTACGFTKHDYLAFDHPLQQAIRAAVAHATEVPADALVAGIDGCSAPNYAVPLGNLALAFARLADGADDPAYGKAPGRLAAAMIAHPEMVSGENGSDRALMRAGRGDWVTKIGAEGVQAIGVRSRGWGIAVKVADGNVRGLHPATVATLDQLGLLDADARAALAQWGRPQLANYRGIVTGETRPAVVLDKTTRRLSRRRVVSAE